MGLETPDQRQAPATRYLGQERKRGFHLRHDRSLDKIQQPHSMLAQLRPVTSKEWQRVKPSQCSVYGRQWAWHVETTLGDVHQGQILSLNEGRVL